MNIAVIGGKLQGVEVVYLAQKAGYQTVVIDKNPQALASRLADTFLVHEFTSDNPFPSLSRRIDMILPAIEDETVLFLLEAWSKAAQIPLAFDLKAYTLSTSKLKSNALFKRLGLPMPRPWPESSLPVVVKPDKASGSMGVAVIKDPDSLEAWVSKQGIDDLVIQEFVEGPSYSIEVLGCPGRYHALQVTDLGMDNEWDCNRVEAPSQLSEKQIHRFKLMALEISEALMFTGIMDLEAIFHANELKLLEIDARFPSQTPMAVFWSTGLNMVKLLVDLTLGKNVRHDEPEEIPVLVEHIKVTHGDIECLGEHIMAMDGPLLLKTDFFGAKEAITSFRENKDQWVATLVFIGNSKEDIHNKRTRCHDRIRGHYRTLWGGKAVPGNRSEIFIGPD
jgi:pyrrolysine biosynthesis protein PylC